MNRAEINLGGNGAADDLEAMLASLDAGSAPAAVAGADEIIEPAMDDSDDSVIEPNLTAAVATDDDLEAMLADTPVADPEPVEAAPVDKKADREAKKAADRAAKKADREAKKAEREAKKAEKPAPVPRKHYASKVERITDKLGEKLGDYTVLTLSDAALTGDELAAKQQETLDLVKGAGVKVQNRMTMLLEFVAGKSGKLNEVIERAFKLLKADGHITVGEKGNFHQNLLAKPYSPAAARAMGNNTLAAMREFSVICKNESGVYVANPESLIYIKVCSMLGI